MTDLEMTLATAELMQVSLMGSHCPVWNPLKDDAQAMALVKELRLTVYARALGADRWWRVEDWNLEYGRDVDLNRAIVECVAKMQTAKACAPS